MYWFVDNKLNINFGNDKTKLILFATKFKMKKVKKLNIRCGDIQIKQHSEFKYLGYMLDEIMSRKAMTLSVINKIKSKLKSIYQKNKFLQLFCNELIRPHFDYAFLPGIPA